MRLVVVGADGVVDMAAPRGRERGLSWPLGRARFLDVGESSPPPGLVVEVERGLPAQGGFAPTLSRWRSQGQSRMSMGPPLVKRGPLA